MDSSKQHRTNARDVYIIYFGIGGVKRDDEGDTKPNNRVFRRKTQNTAREQTPTLFGKQRSANSWSNDKD